MNNGLSIKDLTEEDIKLRFITPALQKSDWDIHSQKNYLKLFRH